MSADIDADEQGKTRLRGIQANGTSIYRARRLRGLTQEALAAAAACDEKTIRRAEKGCRLDLATLVRTASIGAFMLLTTPVSGLVIARASYLAGIPLWKGTVVDERREATSEREA